jgi:hypothetical protein
VPTVYNDGPLVQSWHTVDVSPGFST